MKKSKINSEKILLVLGGAGIVLAVAVIVFLISFNIGGKDIKQEEKTTAPEQIITTQPHTGGTTVNYVESTEGITEVQDVVIDSSCREAVKIFADCLLYGEVEQLEILLPDSVWDKLARDTNVDKQAMIDVFKSYFMGNNVSATLGEGGSVTYDVSSVLVIGDSSAEEIRSAVSTKYGIGKASVTDVYAIGMMMEYTVGGESYSEIDELFCVKIDGVWYLAEKDSLAVYSILEGIISA